MTATARLALTDALQDGHTTVVTDADGQNVILVGTRPLTEAQAEGRRLVREGLADVLAWLGEDVEVPTGRAIADHLRGSATAGLPTSTLAVRPGEHHLRYLAATGPLARDGDYLTGGTGQTMTLDARTAVAARQLPPLEYLARPGVLHRELVDAVEGTYRHLIRILTDDGYVADVTDGYPAPRLRVELSVKAWPAVPGLTTPAEPERERARA